MSSVSDRFAGSRVNFLLAGNKDLSLNGKSGYMHLLRYAPFRGLAGSCNNNQTQINLDSARILNTTVRKVSKYGELYLILPVENKCETET